MGIRHPAWFTALDADGTLDMSWKNRLEQKNLAEVLAAKNIRC